jgi:hypothetical protein
MNVTSLLSSVGELGAFRFLNGSDRPAGLGTGVYVHGEMLQRLGLSMPKALQDAG